MSIEQAAANYRRDLGDGLVLRWASTDDAERLALLVGTVFRDSADAPLNPRMMEFMRRHMRGGYPLVGPGDCALVEDTRHAARPIVACTFLWREEWSYEGIPFRIGRPENIATDPAYRNRGLVRAMIELVHARSAAEGHLVQAITGIPAFYRQFGYEYALDLHGRRVAYVALIPQAKAGAPDPYTFREATIADVPHIVELYNRHRADSIVWNHIPERYWRYLIEVWGPPDAPNDPTIMGVSERIQMIVDTTGSVRGYAVLAAKRWGNDLQVYAVELAPMSACRRRSRRSCGCCTAMGNGCQSSSPTSSRCVRSASSSGARTRSTRCSARRWRHWLSRPTRGTSVCPICRLLSS